MYQREGLLGLTINQAFTPLKVTQVLTEYHPTIREAYSRKGLPLLAYEITSGRKPGKEDIVLYSAHRGT